MLSVSSGVPSGWRTRIVDLSDPNFSNPTKKVELDVDGESVLFEAAAWGHAESLVWVACDTGVSCDLIHPMIFL